MRTATVAGNLEPKEVDEHSCIVLLLQRCAVKHPGSTQKAERLRRAAPEHVSKAGTPLARSRRPSPLCSSVQ